MHYSMIGDTTLTTHRVKYSAAYSTGRELMLEPLYGCAEEALLRRGASSKTSPKGPQGAARERVKKRYCVTATVSEGSDPLNQEPLCVLCVSAPHPC